MALSLFPAPVPMAAAEEGVPTWGLYVYMAGDNSLTEEAAVDLAEMRRAGSNAHRQVVVLIDQDGEDDTRAYRVVRNGVEETALSDINATWDDELDMGEGDVLRDFLVWATTAYPAQRRLLVIWDHGSGWTKVAEDRGSYLMVPEIATALAEYRQATGHGPLTLVGFDACLMGMVEIAQGLAEHAQYIHGSEAFEPNDGWTYDDFIPRLGADTTNEAMVQTVVHSYVESYRNGSEYTGYSVTAAVVDTDRLLALELALDDFAREMRSALPLYRDEITAARADTERYEREYYRDLYHLTERVAADVPLPPLRQAATALQQALEVAVVAEDHWYKPGKREVANAHGLTIYFPTGYPDGRYSQLAVGAGPWGDFLDTYPNPPAPHAALINASAVAIDNGSGYPDTIVLTGNHTGATRLKVLLHDDAGVEVSHASYPLNASGGALPTVALQPSVTGYYRLTALLYDDDDYLQEHFIAAGLWVDLRLPDLAVAVPALHPTGADAAVPPGGVGHLQQGDGAYLTGSVTNLGTVAAHNVTLTLVTDNASWDYIVGQLDPGTTFAWNRSLDAPALGDHAVTVSVNFSDEFEIDADNNRAERSFTVFAAGRHAYAVTASPVNTLEFNGSGFGVLAVQVSFAAAAAQPWDQLQLVVTPPANWSAAVTMPPGSGDDAFTANITLTPPLRTTVGEHTVTLQVIDRNGLVAGASELRVNVPRYHGLRLIGEAAGTLAPGGSLAIELTVENTGNGLERVQVTKLLPEGFAALMSATYLELTAFEAYRLTVDLRADTGIAVGSYALEFNATGLDQELNASITLTVTVAEPDNESWLPAPGLLLLALALLTVARRRRWRW